MQTTISMFTFPTKIKILRPERDGSSHFHAVHLNTVTSYLNPGQIRLCTEHFVDGHSTKEHPPAIDTSAISSGRTNVTARMSLNATKRAHFVFCSLPHLSCLSYDVAHVCYFHFALVFNMQVCPI